MIGQRLFIITLTTYTNNKITRVTLRDVNRNIIVSYTPQFVDNTDSYSFCSRIDITEQSFPVTITITPGFTSEQLQNEKNQPLFDVQIADYYTTCDGGGVGGSGVAANVVNVDEDLIGKRSCTIQATLNLVDNEDHVKNITVKDATNNVIVSYTPIFDYTTGIVPLNSSSYSFCSPKEITKTSFPLTFTVHPGFTADDLKHNPIEMFMVPDDSKTCDGGGGGAAATTTDHHLKWWVWLLISIGALFLFIIIIVIGKKL
jgi:hypothetical protein